MFGRWGVNYILRDHLCLRGLSHGRRFPRAMRSVGVAEWLRMVHYSDGDW